MTPLSSSRRLHEVTVLAAYTGRDQVHRANSWNRKITLLTRARRIYLGSRREATPRSNPARRDRVMSATRLASFNSFPDPSLESELGA